MDEEKCTVTLTTVVPRKDLYPHLLGQSSNGVESFPPRTFGINLGGAERMAILGRVLTQSGNSGTCDTRGSEGGT